MTAVRKYLGRLIIGITGIWVVWQVVHWRWLAIDQQIPERQSFTNGADVRLKKLSWKEFFPNHNHQSEFPWFDDRMPRTFELAAFPYAVSGISAWWFKSSPFDPGSLMSSSRIKSKKGLVITGADTDKMTAWIGTLHSHTGWSDGSGEPAAAFDFGRNLGGLDFMAITDHPEFWLFNEQRNWSTLNEIAKMKTRGDFVAIPGFEYSNPIYGHYIAIGTKGVCSAIKCPSLEDFYDWLNQPGNEDALIAFAHPQVQTNNATRHEFRRFKFEPTLKSMLFGIEVIHWSGHDQFLFGFSGSKPFLDEAIAEGWLPGSIGSQDNHSFNWGRPNARVGVLASELSLDGIMAGLRSRRFYATSSRDLQLSFDAKTVDAKTVSGNWVQMGGHLRLNKQSSQSSRRIETRIRLFEPDVYNPPRRIEWILDGTVVGRYDFAELPNELAGDDAIEAYYAGEITARLNLDDFSPKKPRYIYARVFMGAEFDAFAQTSPIFLDH